MIDGLRKSHVLLVAAAMMASLALTCDDGTQPEQPRPTAVQITPSPVPTLDAIGATQQLTGAVVDQDGNPMSGQTITWASDDETAATVDAATGLVTAVDNGTANITATSGELSATAAVTVQQAAATLTKAGDQQTGTVGTVLAASIEVEVADRLGTVMEAQAVAFEVTQGGGSVGDATVNTNVDGRASTTWTLGTDASVSHQVTATAGEASATFTATATADAPSQAAGLSGDTQTGQVGAVLDVPLVVSVQDQHGNPVGNVNVTFEASGDGSFNPAATTTALNGEAASTWTLGSAEGDQTATVTAEGLTPIMFTATATPPPGNVAIQDGDGQSATVGQALATAPSVLVTDGAATPTPLPGVDVLFEIATGDGAINGGTTETVATDGSGIATASGWVLGTTAGENTLTATVNGIAPVTFTATGNADSETDLVINEGEMQSALSGTDVNVPPSVKVTDQFGNGVSGIDIVFAVETGGGAATGLNQTTGADGVAEVGSWTIQAGANTMSATATGVSLAGDPVTFTASGISAGFNLDIQHANAPTAGQQAAFDAAEAFWESAVVGDLSDVNFATMNLPADACNITHPAVTDIVDDVRIFTVLEAIDGAGNVLGSAGPCVTRTGDGTTIVGIMRFDTADLDALETSGQLGTVIRHEMGHVLGIGTLWPAKGLLQNPSDPAQGGTPFSDTHFTGPQAIRQFDNVGGTAYTAGAKVPVENDNGNFGTGSLDGHWRESVLDTELMTPALDPAAMPNPTSVVTIGSLIDLGYTVDYSVAETYVLPGPPPLVAGPRTKLYLGNDIWQGPLFVRDRSGSLRRIR